MIFHLAKDNFKQNVWLNLFIMAQLCIVAFTFAFAFCEYEKQENATFLKPEYSQNTYDTSPLTSEREKYYWEIKKIPKEKIGARKRVNGNVFGKKYITIEVVTQSLFERLNYKMISREIDVLSPQESYLFMGQNHKMAVNSKKTQLLHGEDSNTEKIEVNIAGILARYTGFSYELLIDGLLVVPNDDKLFNIDNYSDDSILPQYILFEDDAKKIDELAFECHLLRSVIDYTDSYQMALIVCVISFAASLVGVIGLQLIGVYKEKRRHLKLMLIGVSKTQLGLSAMLQKLFLFVPSLVFSLFGKLLAPDGVAFVHVGYAVLLILAFFAATLAIDIFLISKLDIKKRKV